ncbi:MAG: EAL domain-containing protein, partial [Firmicutes bacterium]|nr:EAL domain-containing protein [Bacillota bacterium]
MLEELRKSGFIVEMDDFGSGYSSLNMLKDMPVDVLK